MNAAEHIVELYYRHCLRCFTMADVKVIGGNNRQIDLLAYDLVNRVTYHVETSVFADLVWKLAPDEIAATLDHKFFGAPNPDDGGKSDPTTSTAFVGAFKRTYEKYGVNWDEIERVYCYWTVPLSPSVDQILDEYGKERGIRKPILLSFRNEVLHRLWTEVGAANYSDEVLRTISLLQTRQEQLKQAEKASNNRKMGLHVIKQHPDLA